MPEAHFQNSKAVRMASLAEALAMSDSSGHPAPPLSSFAECVVLATLHSRCMAHRRAAARDRDAIGSGSSAGARGFWGRHEWLAGVVDRRVRLLGRGRAVSHSEGGSEAADEGGEGEGEGEDGAATWTSIWAPAVERDPMLLFTHMLAYSLVVCLGAIVQATPCHATSAQHPHTLMAPVYEQRASRAAADMARLVNDLPSLSCFKAHPFLPKPLATAVAFLQAQPAPPQDTHTVCHTLLRVLRDLRDVNSLALDICLAHLV